MYKVITECFLRVYEVTVLVAHRDEEVWDTETAREAITG